ncbi:hypothetical protein Tco_0612481, partial [Tanacetum coccineum]
NALNMFSIQIHHGGRFHKYPGRKYVDGHVDIFDMVDIDLFTVIAVNRMVLQLCYQGSVCDSVTSRSLPQHDSSTPGKDSICESVTPRCMPHGSGINNSGLSHDESFKVNDLDLNLNIIETQTKLHVLEVLVFEEADVGRIEVPVYEEADVGRTKVPVSKEADFGRTEEHVVEQVIVGDVVDDSYEEDVEQGNGQEAVEAPSGEQVDYDVEKVESSEDTGTYDEDDDDDDFLVDEENEIVKLYVDAHFLDVDVVNLDGFDSYTCNDNETSNYRRKRDYGVELQSTNPNTTVKIVVERNIDPVLPTRAF